VHLCVGLCVDAIAKSQATHISVYTHISTHTLFSVSLVVDRVGSLLTSVLHTHQRLLYMKDMCFQVRVRMHTTTHRETYRT